MASNTEAPEKSAAGEGQGSLSAGDFATYNSAATKMDLFHNHFRQVWGVLWQACTSNTRPQGMSLRQFLELGLQFSADLTRHHDIEETYVFPRLAERMPEFDPKEGVLVLQHVDIHAGLDEFTGYLERCRKGQQDFEMAGLKQRMEPWGNVLWQHLDLEVETLKAANMSKYWSLEEMKRMPM